MTILSVSVGTKISVIGDDERTTFTPVGDLAGKTVNVYDTYGHKKKLSIGAAPVIENLYTLRSPLTGEGMFVGESHTVLHRGLERAEFVRKSIKSITDVGYVKAIQRRIHMEDRLSVFDAFSMEDSGAIILEVPKASLFTQYMEVVSASGILVMRKRVEPIVILDPRRPSCFATKLINGSFTENLPETINGLAAGGVLQPYRMFDDAFIEETNRTGVVFEGNSIFQEVPLEPPRDLKKRGEVFLITSPADEGVFPVELTWFSS